MKGPEIHRLYYSTSELCRLFELEPYLLRLWEEKFPGLKPVRSKTGRRLYKPIDLEYLAMIKKLKDEGFSDQRIRRLIKASGRREFIEHVRDLKPKSAELTGLINELKNWLGDILAIIETP